ncbi:MAG: preprotein translocase subunit YajC [Desulfovibrio sp. MES5]|nr:MAG: preprotein translocase subunit YajC [Desulfovibrio sp. MES5]
MTLLHLWRCVLFESVAYAMGTPQAGAGPASGTDMLMQFLPLIVMFVIFWFLLIRPQQKRAKAHKAMLAELKRGDHVITSAGLIGRILEIDDEQVLLESGESKLRVTRGAIGGLVPGKGGKDDSK